MVASPPCHTNHNSSNKAGNLQRGILVVYTEENTGIVYRKLTEKNTGSLQKFTEENVGSLRET